MDNRNSKTILQHGIILPTEWLNKDDSNQSLHFLSAPGMNNYNISIKYLK